MLDHQDLARQLVRHLRGRRSQRALSRRLQYTTNVVYRWEHGRRWPTGAAFLWLALRTGRDVGALLDGFAPADWREPRVPPASPAAVAALMRALQGTTPATELAARMGRSRNALGRWLRGQAEPRLPELAPQRGDEELRAGDVPAAYAIRDFLRAALGARPRTLPAARMPPGDLCREAASGRRRRSGNSP